MRVAFTAGVLLERGVRTRPTRGVGDGCAGPHGSRRGIRGGPGGGREGAGGAVYCLRPVAPGPREASPSLVYGAALLMRFGLTPIPGSNPGASAAVLPRVRRYN